jgi:DNA repair protein RadD
MILRGYQTEVSDKARGSYRSGHKAPVIVMPTGSGKTPTLADIAKKAAAKGTSVLVLAHRRELIKQASNKLMDADVSHGIIAPGFTPSREIVQVGSVQTVARRLDELPQFGLIIVDEAHHSIAGSYKKIIEAQPNAKLLGVTATPERLDGRGLGKSSGGCFDDIIIGPSVSELIELGFLTPARIFAPADAPDLSGIRTKMGDYETAGLLAKIDVPTLTGDVVAHYAQHSPGLPAIAFCITVEHAKHVAATFKAAGWRAVAAHGGMTAPERDASINGLATGAVQILCTCDLVSEGLDVPAVGAVILLRPTKSLGLFLQQVGRGLRPAPGKQHLIVLDHAGCTMQHGLPDSPRPWSLDGRPKKEKPPAIKQCKSCWALHSPAPSCPSCGFVYPKAKEGEGRQIEQRDGVLAEITGDRLAAMRAVPIQQLLKGAKTRDDLETIRKAKGYKAGWTYHILKERQERTRTATVAA